MTELYLEAGKLLLSGITVHQSIENCTVQETHLHQSGHALFIYLLVCVLRLVCLPVCLFTLSCFLWNWHVTSTRDRSCPLPLPPGGYGLPILGETLHMLIGGKKFFERRRSQYGDVYKTHLLGKPAVRVAGADWVKVVLRGENHLVQTQWPASTSILLGQGSLSHAAGSEHSAKKRAMMRAFSFDALSNYLPCIQHVTRAYISKWCGQKRIMGFKEIKTMYFDLTCRLMLGFHSSEVENLMTVFENFISNIISIPLDVKGTGFRKAREARDILLNKIDEVLQERQQGDECFIDALTTIMKDKSSDSLTVSEVKNMCLELLFAGHGTTSSAAACMVYELAKHPDVIHRLWEELDTFGLLESQESAVEFQQINQLTYLNNVLKEVLRLHPPVGGGFKKALRTFEINGYQVPKGWTVVYSIRDTQEMSTAFHCPSEFNPDRWQIPSSGKCQFDYLPFGGGKRICAGKDLASLMLKVFALELVRRCGWKLVNEVTEFDTFPAPTPTDGLPLVFTPISQH